MSTTPLPFLWHNLVAALQQAGIEIDSAALLQRSTSPHPLQQLQQEPLLDKQGRPLQIDTICQAIERHSRIPYALFDPTRLAFEACHTQISTPYLVNRRLIPLSSNDNNITFVSDNPYDQSWQEDIKRLTPKKITPVFTHPELLNSAVMQWQRLADSYQATRQHMPEQDEVREYIENSDNPVIELNNWLWDYAFIHRASDIHLEPQEKHGTIRMRIDGDMHMVQKLDPALFRSLIARLKVLAQADVIEKRRPQDGRIKLTRRNENNQEAQFELRLATIPTLFGEKCVIRVFDASITGMSGAELGFDSGDQKRWDSLCKQKNGLVLICGPTGSGKTSTLYNTLRRLAQPQINLCTIEDPIEMVVPGFNQTQLNPGVDLSFANGLRALLRMDPDIIMVGEIRDSDTAQIAVQAALTGHLVFSTIHTNNASAALTRLKDLGIADYLLSATLRGVLAQRLVRTLCPQCKEKTGPYYKAIGCTECRDTGYKGRRAVFELATEFPPEHAPRDPMSPLQQAALSLLENGSIDIPEMQRVVGLPAEIAQHH